jgi:hypothetical protein
MNDFKGGGMAILAMKIAEKLMGWKPVPLPSGIIGQALVL